MENDLLKIARLNKMVEEIEDYAILLLDRKGNIENWNKGAEKIKGYKASEIIGKNFETFYTTEDRKNGRPTLLITTAAEKGSVRDEGWRVRKDGTCFWGSVVITAIHDDEGAVIGFTKVTRDLTAQKENHERLKASEERYTRMVAEVQDYAIISLDTEGNIENWNSGAEKIKGYKPEEIIGKNFRTFYTEKDRQDKFPESFLARARENGRAQHEGWRVRKDGTYFWGSVVITALHDDEGNVIGFSKVTRDLTERKLAEETQQKYLEQLETRNREMEQLAYIASHDLQEPLRTINNFLDLFRIKYSHIVDEKGKMFIDVIMQSTGRMKELIKGVLDYSILGINQDIKEIDCNHLLQDVLKDLSLSISSTGASINVDPLPVIHGYNIELRQLFQNLISNAIKFRKPDTAPVINISANKSFDKWLFTISDNGIGIDNSVFHKIFLIFQRLHSRDQYPGTGMGLAYVKKIVELHNGKIWIDSQPGKGSTFYFMLADMIPAQSAIKSSRPVTISL
ncbi:sensor histidine kinase [Chitinophagaceae bacterium MMS25-I14]